MPGILYFCFVDGLESPTASLQGTSTISFLSRVSWVHEPRLWVKCVARNCLSPESNVFVFLRKFASELAGFLFFNFLGTVRTRSQREHLGPDVS